MTTLLNQNIMQSILNSDVHQWIDELTMFSALKCNKDVERVKYLLTEVGACLTNISPKRDTTVFFYIEERDSIFE